MSTQLHGKLKASPKPEPSPPGPTRRAGSAIPRSGSHSWTQADPSRPCGHRPRAATEPPLADLPLTTPGRRARTALRAPRRVTPLHGRQVWPRPGPPGPSQLSGAAGGQGRRPAGAGRASPGAVSPATTPAQARRGPVAPAPRPRLTLLDAAHDVAQQGGPPRPLSAGTAGPGARIFRRRPLPAAPRRRHRSPGVAQRDASPRCAATARRSIHPPP